MNMMNLNIMMKFKFKFGISPTRSSTEIVIMQAVLIVDKSTRVSSCLAGCLAGVSVGDSESNLPVQSRCTALTAGGVTARVQLQFKLRVILLLLLLSLK
jgi:hypothetical protein